MQMTGRLAGLQMLIGVIAALVWGVCGGTRHMLAAVVGGGIAALLTLYTGLQVFGKARRSPEAIMRNFYSAMARKFFLAAALFLFAVRGFAHDFVPLISTFALTLSVYWLALAWPTLTNSRNGWHNG